ncbi:MAG: PAS domain S-box protein [Deltaproteobacteria bacterium]|nr:PAS domain S-box protein [Deltaproteobacteria bacterium]
MAEKLPYEVLEQKIRALERENKLKHSPSTKELSRQENSLDEGDEIFRALAENSYDTIMRFDRECRHLYVNPIAAKQTGIAREDFIGKTHDELGFSEDLVLMWEEAIQTVFDTGKPNRIEFLLPSNIWIDWLLVPECDDHGNVKTVMTSARDISEFKRATAAFLESEERYRSLVDDSPDIIYRLNAKGEIVSINQNISKCFGYDDAQDVLGKPYAAFVDFIHPDDVDNVMMSFKGIVTARDFFTDELSLRLRKKDGTFIWVELHSRNVLDHEGNFVEVIGVMRDITDRKRIEKETVLIEKMRSVLEMAGTICHEMNQPMQIISGYTDLLLKKEEQQDGNSEKLTIIKEQIERMRTITQKLLSLEDYQPKDYAGIGKILDINGMSRVPVTE